MSPCFVTINYCGGKINATTMHTVAKLHINVSAVIPLCGNMPKGKVLKSDNIVTTLNGKWFPNRKIERRDDLSALPMLDGQENHKFITSIILKRYMSI